MNGERNSSRTARFDHSLGLREIRSHRLLADDRNSVLRGHQNKRRMCVHVRNDVEKIELLALQQLFGTVINCGNSKFRSKFFGFAARAIVQRNAFNAFQFAPARELVPRPESCPKNREAQPLHLSQTLLPGGGYFFDASSNTRTQSRSSPELGEMNSRSPVFGNSPSSLALPSRGLNHQVFTLAPVIFVMFTLKARPTGA